MTIEEARTARPGDMIKLVGLSASLEQYPYKNDDVLIVDDPPTEVIDQIFFLRVNASPGRMLPKYAEFYHKEKLCTCELRLLMIKGCTCNGK